LTPLLCFLVKLALWRKIKVTIEILCLVHLLFFDEAIQQLETSDAFEISLRSRSVFTNASRY
jgi:hypothetical protein